MKPPWRARYGARDNLHGLLEWEGPREPPVRLTRLTDRPPGYPSPRERWWPSVGCGPVDDQWALWWTLPDHDAARSGMVHAEVALWPLEDVGALSSLRPFLAELSGGASIDAPSFEFAESVARLLLQERFVPIVPGLDAWPGLLCLLWTRLWPSLKPTFSARVALGPPNRGDATAPLLFATPLDRVPQWPHEHVVSPRSNIEEHQRAAAWWVGRSDPTVDEVISSVPALPGELVSLRRVARAADRIDLLRRAPDAPRALDVIRTLNAIGSRGGAAELLAEVTGHLIVGLADTALETIVSLRNVDIGRLAGERGIRDGVHVWIELNGAALSVEDARALLSYSSASPAEPWWREVVCGALKSALQHLDEPWAEAVASWLTCTECVAALAGLLPTTPEAEQKILAVVADGRWSSDQVRQLGKEARRRRWSRLHAWSVVRGESPRDALRAQLAWPHAENLGLAHVVTAIPGTDAVSVAVEENSDELTALVALRTVEEPSLLEPIDSRSAGWRALWTAHVELGGIDWPPDVDRRCVAHGLFDAVLGGEESTVLLERLADRLGGSVLEYPRRDELWTAVSEEIRGGLLSAAADALLREYERGGSARVPERALMNAVLERVREGRPSPNVVAGLLSAAQGLKEGEVIEWIERGSAHDWTRVATAIGQGVERRGWRQAAVVLYKRWCRDRSLRGGPMACRSLLPRPKRWILSCYGRPGPSDGSRGSLTDVLAELGAELKPDELDILWERAGGSRKSLPTEGNPWARWHAAVREARDGGLEGGLAALHAKLLEALPHNQDLQDIGRLIRSGQPAHPNRRRSE